MLGKKCEKTKLNCVLIVKLSFSRFLGTTVKSRVCCIDFFLIKTFYCYLVNTSFGISINTTDAKFRQKNSTVFFQFETVILSSSVTIAVIKHFVDSSILSTTTHATINCYKSVYQIELNVNYCSGKMYYSVKGNA